MSAELINYVRQNVEKGSIFIQLAKQLREAGNPLSEDALISQIVRSQGKIEILSQQDQSLER